METVKLQGIGTRKATKAAELVAGMTCIWNYGYTSEVVSVEPSKTGKTVTVYLRSNTDGVVRGRKMTAGRLVAIR